MEMQKSPRIFWPTSGIARSEGLVLGQKLQDVIVVVGIVEQWVGAQVDRIKC
jgi:hypothetical protein